MREQTPAQSERGFLLSPVVLASLQLYVSPRTYTGIPVWLRRLHCSVSNGAYSNSILLFPYHPHFRRSLPRGGDGALTLTYATTLEFASSSVANRSSTSSCRRTWPWRGGPCRPRSSHR